MVWRAHDVVLGREVAVKEVVFPASLSAAERHSAQARVAREARAAARLNHPGVVTLYDVVTSQGSVFLVMELVEAPTLAELVRVEGPLAPERVAEIGAQVASALEAAHQAGIVHRDVKPANVLVPPSGSAKLADFGVASLADDPRLTTTGLVIGSPAYMAPEQAKGEGPARRPTSGRWGRRCTSRSRASRRSTRALRWRPGRGSQRGAKPMPELGPLAPLLAALLAKDPQTRRPVQGPGWPGSGRDTFNSPHPDLPTQRPGPARPRTLPPSEEIPNIRTGPDAGYGAFGGTGTGPAAIPPDPSAGPTCAPPGAAAARRGCRAGRRRDADRRANRDLPARPDPGPDGPGHYQPKPGGDLRRGSGDPGHGQGRRRCNGHDRARSVDHQGACEHPSAHDPNVLPHPRPAFRPVGAPSPTRPEPAPAPPPGVPGPDPRELQRHRHRGPPIPVGYSPCAPRPPPPWLPQASRDYRSWARRNFAGFREVSYKENQTYADQKGAVVFEYVAVRDGRWVHVSHTNVKGRSWGYNVEFIVPAEQSEGLPGAGPPV